MRLAKLKRERKRLYQALKDIDSVVMPEGIVRAMKSDINYEIACVEEAIDLERKIRPFKWGIIGFAGIAAAMLLYYYW